MRDRSWNVLGPLFFGLVLLLSAWIPGCRSRETPQPQPTPAAPTVPAVPGTPGMPTTPGVPGAPGAPGMPTAPVAPGMPGMPAAPAAPAPASVQGMVTIRPGSFMMGTPFTESERDVDEMQHSVTLTRGFLMQATEVTQAEFQAAMGYNPSEYPSCGPGCPVENIGWSEAAAYTVALSLREGRAPCYSCTGQGPATFCTPVGDPYSCQGYRLPTEAEWEYAARAGTPWMTPQGDNPPTMMDCQEPNPVLDPIAWFCGNSGRTTHAVRTRSPNAWGLYDMLGNVYEWIHDWYGDYQAGGAVDPSGPPFGTERVVRGGSFCCTHNRDVRCGERMSEPSMTTRHGALGMRVVRAL